MPQVPSVVLGVWAMLVELGFFVLLSTLLCGGVSCRKRPEAPTRSPPALIVSFLISHTIPCLFPGRYSRPHKRGISTHIGADPLVHRLATCVRGMSQQGVGYHTASLKRLVCPLLIVAVM